MTASLNRARPFQLAASAAVLLACSVGAGRVLTIQNSGTEQAIADNPVAGLPAPSLPSILPEEPGVPATTPSTIAAPAGVPTSVVTPTTSAAPLVDVVCRWTSKILAGGIAGPLGVGPSDQFAVTVTNSDWSGKEITYRKSYSAPAVLRQVIAMPSTTVRADSNGTVTFVLPVGPESQGGAISVLAQVVGNNSDVLDVCGWQQFTVDYNGPSGLVGGIGASAAKLLKL